MTTDFVVYPARSSQRSSRASELHPDDHLPGALVFHGGAGLGDHERARAQMLADLGYVAFAPDLFGKNFASRAEGIAEITALVASPETLRSRVNSALLSLRAQPGVDPSNVVAIGFCFGGLAALELARSGANVRAVASFHGGLGTQAPAEKGGIVASILVCTGSADPFVPRAQRAAFEDEMIAAEAQWQMLVHGGAQHGFTESGNAPGARPGIAYHAEADRQSWAAMRALFSQCASAV